METKYFNGRVTETKEEERNGVKVGLISGYIATWDVDRGDDMFTKGCFLDSLADHVNNNRQIRFKDSHGRTVGGFPIITVKEDDKGLFGIGEINLEVQQGMEAFKLAKQGVLTDFSVGYSVDDYEIKEGVRIIKKAIIWEGSIVDEPMNPKANITSVKALEQKHTVETLEKMTVRELESVFKNVMSKSASTKYANMFHVKHSKKSDNDETLSKIMLDLKSMLE